MIEHVCKLLMIGRATNDPTKRTRGRATVVAFGFVFNDRYKDRERWIDCPMFIDCEAYAELAERVYAAIRRGYMILVEGKLRLDQWEDANKVKHRKHKVILSDFKVIEKPKAKPKPPEPSEPTTVEDDSPADNLFADTEPEPI